MSDQWPQSGFINKELGPHPGQVSVLCMSEFKKEKIQRMLEREETMGREQTSERDKSRYVFLKA